MTYEQLTNIFRADHLPPWEHDFYWAFFDKKADAHEITTKAYEEIENLEKFFCVAKGNNVYFIVDKGTIIPEGFLETLSQITDVPTEPPVVAEDTTTPE